MNIDRDRFISTLGGSEKVAQMDSEAKADAFEDFLSNELDNELDAALLSTDKNYPTVAEVEARIDTRHYRMGVGNLFVATKPGGKVKKLPPMPHQPTLYDFFERRFAPANH